MTGRINNVHERVIEASPSALAPLLERLGGPDDVLWPAPAWEPMILDGPPVVGADGGHGPIRYRVVEAEPGRRVRFEFHSMPGIVGHHELAVEPLPDGRALVRHVLDCRASGRMRVLGPILLEPLHDAVLEDLLDNAERATTGSVARPARWSWWVRLLRGVDLPAVRTVDVPDRAVLARRTLAEQAGAPGALVDAFAVPVWRGFPTDPQYWADATFRDLPGWVRAAFAVRQAVAAVVGIDRGEPADFFSTRERTETEVLLGGDPGHLRFRASVLVADGAVTLTTVSAPSNSKGRAYLAVVRRVHPSVIRAMLRRAHRRAAQHRRIRLGVS